MRLWRLCNPGIQLGRSDEPAEIQKKAAHDPDLFLVAQEGDQIIGTVIGGFDGRRGMMYHLAVAQEYRGQGISSRLVEELEDRLQKKGCHRYYLMVTYDNENAIRYYENHGWELMRLYTYAKNLD